MSKILKVSDEVYEALQILKVYPSTSFSDIIKGLIDHYCPGDFFGDIDEIDRQLLREETGLEDYTTGELRQIIKQKKMRGKKRENNNVDE